MKKLFTIILISLLLSTFAFAANVKVLDIRADESYYEIADNGNNDLDVGTDYTIEAWIYIKDVAHGNERIFRSQGWQIYVVSGTGDGGADATVKFDGTFMPAGSITLTVPTEEWHHIALQGNSAGGWTNNYLDGTVSQNGGATDITGTLNLRVGSYSTAGTGFDGAIDEVRISDNNRYGRWGFTVTRNDPPFTSDANTMLLCHLDDDAIPPTNSSSKVFTITNSGLTTGNYVAHDDVSFAQDLPLPITLTSFTATAVNGIVELDWETATETDNAQFIIYRNNEVIGTLAGTGTTSEPNFYNYTDINVIPGMTYTYVLADMSYANEETRYESDAVTVTIANDLIEAGFVVGAAYPNPFNPMTIVPLTLTKSADVHAALYDASGHELKVIMNSTLSAGTYSLEINGNDLSTGLYLVKITVDNVLNVRKISLMK